MIFSSQLSSYSPSQPQAFWVLTLNLAGVDPQVCPPNNLCGMLILQRYLDDAVQRAALDFNVRLSVASTLDQLEAATQSDTDQLTIEQPEKDKQAQRPQPVFASQIGADGTGLNNCRFIWVCSLRLVSKVQSAILEILRDVKLADSSQLAWRDEEEGWRVVHNPTKAPFITPSAKT